MIVFTSPPLIRNFVKSIFEFFDLRLRVPQLLQKNLMLSDLVNDVWTQVDPLTFMEDAN
jgi:hypothetical protein